MQASSILKHVVFLSGILFYTASAANASTILVATRTPGFVANPTVRILTVDSSGTMTLQTRDLRTGTFSLESLADLTPSMMDRIRADLEGIDLSTPLVDQQQGQPMCTDLPSVTVSAVYGAHQIEIKREAGCHEWDLQTAQGLKAAALVLEFLDF
jgi:hypothetical protein